MVTLRISFDLSRLIGILIAIVFVTRVGNLLVCSRFTLGILILLRNGRNIVFKRKQTMLEIQMAHTAQGRRRCIEPHLRNGGVDVHLFKKVPITFASTSSVSTSATKVLTRINPRCHPTARSGDRQPGQFFGCTEFTTLICSRCAIYDRIAASHFLPVISVTRNDWP